MIVFKFLTDNIPDVPESSDNWWNEPDVVQHMTANEMLIQVHNLCIDYLDMPN